MKVNWTLAFSIFVTSRHLNATFSWSRGLKLKMLGNQEESGSSASGIDRDSPLRYPLLPDPKSHSESSDDDFPKGKYITPEQLKEMGAWVDGVYESESGAELWFLGTANAPNRHSILAEKDETITTLYESFKQSASRKNLEFEKLLESAIEKLSEMPAETVWDLTIIADYFQMLGHFTGYRKEFHWLNELEVQNMSLIMPLRSKLAKLLAENKKVDVLLSVLEKKISKAQAFLLHRPQEEA